MIDLAVLKGSSFVVLGLARSGLATVRALVAAGIDCIAWDDNASSRDLAAGMGARVVDPTTTNWSAVTALVISPGIPSVLPKPHPVAVAARGAGKPIICDIELLARAQPEARFVAITGTNGKSTTTALVHHILRTAGVPSAMGGNIGLPILAQDPLPAGGVYVLELSSYQIDLCQSLDCDVAVLLNITPDHLDRYDSFEAYAASKARLFAMQSREHQKIVASNDGIAGEVYQRLFRDFPLKAWSNYNNSNASDRWDLWSLAKAENLSEQQHWPSLRGPHNAQNANAAIMTCVGLGLSEEIISQGLRTYPGLPHRMERVREKDGVLFVNDSKATNAEAAAPALAAYPKVRWILGGQAKTDSLGDTAAQLDHVVKAYTIGEAGPMFATLLRSQGVAAEECETLEIAVNRAARDSQPGEVVLLSPASASFDQFRDFEARGDRFRELVEGL
jgi:UDP-N-acetylmuramoylalanine--D-glutamate ligase